MKDKPIRSIVKALSWRVTATLMIMIASLVITGKMESALTIGLIDFIGKLIVYYAHERLWERIGFGRVKPKEPEYFI